MPLLDAPGEVQMAIDLWLFEQHCLGLQPPTLRFYTWTPAAISLGYHQSKFPKAWEHLVWQDQPMSLVRRPSGGRAVLHQGDLTYGVIGSGFAANRHEAYRQICQFLVAGWRSLSVPLQYGSAGRGYIHNPNCFGTATGADLITDTGTKLIGSAQLRRGNAILQHGSIRLNPDPDLFQTVFGLPCHATLPTQFLIPTVIEALTIAASQCFGVQLMEQPLSVEEWGAIEALRVILQSDVKCGKK
jgi:lipoate---protein ligase